MSENNRGQKRPPQCDVSDDGGGKKLAMLAAAASSAASSHGVDGNCWLCLDAKHGSEVPLRRDCSCRGGSGWAHFQCIVEYAKQKNEAWNGEDPDEFIKPWKHCSGCHQLYQNELVVDLATEFVSFVEENYPDDQEKHLAALQRKLAALRNMVERLQP